MNKMNKSERAIYLVLRLKFFILLLCRRYETLISHVSPIGYISMYSTDYMRVDILENKSTKINGGRFPL